MWAITKDYIESDAVGKTGPYGIRASFTDIVNNPNKQSFRLYDDDGILYYEGVMIEDLHSDPFEPLDDFGTPYAGCTQMQVKDPKLGWQDL